MNFRLTPHKLGLREEIQVENNYITVIHTENQQYSIVAKDSKRKKIITAFARVTLTNVPDMLIIIQALIKRQSQSSPNFFNVN